MLVISSELDEITTYASRVRVLREPPPSRRPDGRGRLAGAIMRTIAGTPSEECARDPRPPPLRPPQLLALALVLASTPWCSLLFDLTVRTSASMGR